MPDAKKLLILVHPGSACGSADFNLGDEGPAARGALAREIMDWQHDMLIVDGALSDELAIYPVMGIAIENTLDQNDRLVVREVACDFTFERWPEKVAKKLSEMWPGGPHDVRITGAWVHEDGTGCVNAVKEAIAPSGHRIEISTTALLLP